MKNESIIASRKSRIFAFMIDYIILSAIFGMLNIKFIINPETETELLLFLFFVGMAIFLLIFSFKDAFKGRSIGKWIIGIGVREKGNLNEIPSIPKLFLRNLILPLGFIEFLVLALNKDKQRIGDRLANTVVIKTKEMSILKKIIVVLSTVVLIFLFMFALILMMLKSSDAYKASEDFILQDENIIEKTGGIEGFGFFPTGSIQTTNGYGEGIFTIKVKGKEKDVYVNVYSTKEPREDWYVQEIK